MEAKFKATFAKVKSAITAHELADKIKIYSKYLGPYTVVVLYTGTQKPYTDQMVTLGTLGKELRVATETAVLYHRDQFLVEFEGKQEAKIAQEIALLFSFEQIATAKRSNDEPDNAGHKKS